MPFNQSDFARVRSALQYCASILTKENPDESKAYYETAVKFSLLEDLVIEKVKKCWSCLEPLDFEDKCPSCIVLLARGIAASPGWFDKNEKVKLND